MIRLRHLLTATLLSCLAFAKAQEVTFSTLGGFYDNPFELTLSCDQHGKVIHYTTNGNTPTTNDPVYCEPLFLDQRQQSHSNIYTILNCPEKDWYLPDSVQKCIVIRAAVFDENGTRLGAVSTQSYFIKSIGCHTHGLPVLSLCVDSLDLFDYERGIFVPGMYFHDWNLDYSGNYYQEGREWERECNFEFIEPSNEGLNQKAGVRIQGNGSRRFSQKGLKFYAREEYGNKRFRYKFFKDLEIGGFKHLRIKPFNSGYEDLGCQDYLCNQIAQNTKVDGLASRPVLLFLNGEYWGIYFMQEKPDERYLDDHYDTDLNRLNIIGNWQGLSEYGDNAGFLALYDWIETNDLSQEENYDYVASQIDIENFIDYQILELFTANTDWPANNMRCWQEGNGYWRWIYFDGDACLIKPNFDVFANATYDKDGNYYMTNARSTLFFRKLLKNQTFKDQFFARFNQLLESALSYSNTKLLYDDTYNAISKEIPNQCQRFGHPESPQIWEEQVQRIDRFLAQRASDISQVICDRYLNYNVGLAITRITPNPASNHIIVNIEAEETQQTDVQVFDLFGRELARFHCILGVGHNEIPLSLNLASGIYLIRAGASVSKLIIN